MTKLLEGGRKKFALGRAGPAATAAGGAGAGGAPGASGATASAMARRAIFLSASKAKATAPRIVEAPGAVTAHHEEAPAHDGAVSSAAVGRLCEGVQVVDMSLSEGARSGGPVAGIASASAGAASSAAAAAPMVSVPSKPAFAPFPSTVSLGDSPSGAPADADVRNDESAEEDAAAATIKTPKKSLEAAFSAAPDVENAGVTSSAKGASGLASASVGMKPVLTLGVGSTAAAPALAKREPLSPSRGLNGRR